MIYAERGHKMDSIEKKAKFKILAERRTNKILDDLRLLGNLSNSSNYSYDIKDVEKIFNAIEEEVSNVKILFKNDHKDRKFKN